MKQNQKYQPAKKAVASIGETVEPGQKFHVARIIRIPASYMALAIVNSHSVFFHFMFGERWGWFTVQKDIVGVEPALSNSPEVLRTF